MAQTVREVMTPDPVVLPGSTTLTQAAQRMKEHHIGDVLVLNADERLCGIVTDRDVVIRGVAEGRDLDSTSVEDICSHEIITVSPEDDIGSAVEAMRDRAVRRLPVVEGDQPVGILSIGDLAMERDPGSALADISSAPPRE
jgi:CBS domain-containing protein